MFQNYFLREKGKMQEVSLLFYEESFGNLIISNATRRNSSLHLYKSKKEEWKIKNITLIVIPVGMKFFFNHSLTFNSCNFHFRSINTLT